MQLYFIMFTLEIYITVIPGFLFFCQWTSSTCQYTYIKGDVDHLEKIVFKRKIVNVFYPQFSQPKICEFSHWDINVQYLVSKQNLLICNWNSPYSSVFELHLTLMCIGQNRDVMTYQSKDFQVLLFRPETAGGDKHTIPSSQNHMY